MTTRPAPFTFVGAIKADPGPIPDLKPPKQEIDAGIPERAIMAGVIVLAFAVLILGRIFRRPKMVAPLPPEHPAAAVRRVLSQMTPNGSPAAEAAEVAHAVRDYLRTAFGLGEEELTTLELSDRFGAHRLASADLAVSVQQFLRDCDAMQFAPAGDARVASIVDRATSLIDELEGQRTPPASPPPPLPVAT